MHNEFGIKRPIGYDEAAQDGLFPKIGTGWLKKNDVPYFFYTQYPVKPLDFDYALAGDDGDGKNPTKSLNFSLKLYQNIEYGALNFKAAFVDFDFATVNF